MKWGAMVLWEKRRRKGSGEYYDKAIVVIPRFMMRMIESDPEFAERYKEAYALERLHEFRECQGQIIASVEAVDEPCWGGHICQARDQLHLFYVWLHEFPRLARR